MSAKIQLLNLLVFLAFDIVVLQFVPTCAIGHSSFQSMIRQTHYVFVPLLYIPSYLADEHRRDFRSLNTLTELPRR